MSKFYCVSVIIPFYNAEQFLSGCIDVLQKQDFDKSFEVIMIDDASTDNSLNIIKKNDKLLNLKIYSLEKNSGPSAARNLGLKHATGEYVFFLDVDDSISHNFLSKMYNAAKDGNYDLVFSDKKRIENVKNQRENIYVYQEDKVFSRKDILEELKKRLHNPLAMGGLVDLTGRFFKRSIIKDNNLLFLEELRYLEDESFAWSILAFVKKAKYLRQQIYTYYMYPNVSSALSAGIDKGYSITNFKLIKYNVEKCFEAFGLTSIDTEKLADQAFIFFIINALISYSRSMLLGKVDLKTGTICRKKLIKDIITDKDVAKSIRNYLPSQNENRWIPRAIRWRSSIILEYASKIRAQEILKIRRKALYN